MVNERSKYRGPDIILKKRQALGHGECQNCGHQVTWYDMLPDEDYTNCVICSGFMIIRRDKSQKLEDDF